ncbi:HsdR family type I site-specific deoxyribonuclease [Sporolactobacillus sp. CQH2019]|uniref:type I restriction endonuclease subunit R n=1 Tax=Sporolactobacillus sp. CQH2019 TaxID=3023512 RepID=UPI002368D81F|nr:HsdR family type I site-specific deoxyribonuclease [Sporolactobacillus sp. CQH2019]MDD9149977.1 HsdR family type I site-specific deoxyribonuclease [Sporolactobacillus sp. CQH2019]
MSAEHNEQVFESKLVEHLANLGGTKQWRFTPEIKTTAQLWINFKQILEKNNPDKLNQPLSETEFGQVKSEIISLMTPYQAGQFLYGLNGVSQIEVDLDDGRHVFLTVFDQDQIGAGNTVYQIVTQIKRPAVVSGKKERRFDVTLLINGLPIIQIEEKADGHDAKEALNQMHQYIQEKQYTDIFSTVQILVAITPHDARYMANTTADRFNTDFAFRWQREEDNVPVRDWREFANKMLSIPMAHRMATNYMILDGTKNRQMIKVMRPYQVYATRRVIQKLREHQFGMDAKEVGYIWHTTGSGKTISSFKAAWLASRLPNVDKVVFLVDRIALTNQTVDEYKAYDPDSGEDGKNGVVDETANKRVLAQKLKSKKSGIIVTSTQKMDGLVRRESFPKLDKNVVFIVDEAHRSTSGDMLKRIKEAFPKSAWIGYTGTPVFDTNNGPTTRQIFGDLLHAYTIRDAIADRNVLGFKVDFETTLSDEVMRQDYLPQYFQYRYPQWNDEEVQVRIAHLAPEDMDDTIVPSVYDMNPKHVSLVVADVLKNWKKRSNNYKYNALFTTHVGGGKASTPMAMMYYDEFKKQNAAMERPLKIGITFSQDTSNGDHQLETNESLHRATQDYNETFGSHFDDRQVKEYTESVVSRLNKTADDGRYLDLVIVVDQLLTGFNAPELNTLYVDRTLKGAALIQAYSRTNRVQNMQDKPFGRIVNYRWPQNSEKLMKEALAKYANRNSANVQTELDIDDGDGILEKPFDELMSEMKQIVSDLNDLSNGFENLPRSESQQERMYELLHHYNRTMAKLKQDDRYDDQNPEALLQELGISGDDEIKLTTTFANELKEHIAKKRHLDIEDLTLRMEHVKDVEVNYDYLEELIAQLANQVHINDLVGAQSTRQEVDKLADQLEDQKYAQQIKATTSALVDGSAEVSEYPVQVSHVKQLIRSNTARHERAEILGFKRQWGLVDIKNTQLINELIDKHTQGADDLNQTGELNTIIREGQAFYQEDAELDEVHHLSKVKYRNELRHAFTTFADKIKKKY